MTAYLIMGDGTRRKLPELLEWEVEYGCGTPCDSFRVVCLWNTENDTLLANAARFEAVHEDELVFSGVVDESEVSWSAQGCRLEVNGRGMAALLLDNEAVGTDYEVATIQDILKELNLDEKTFQPKSVLSVISSAKDRYESPEAFRQDVTALSDYLYEITGYRCEFYRFPGGSSNTIIQFDKNQLFDILEEEELVYFDWNVTSKDASSYRLSSQAITSNVLNGVQQSDKAVVLMHDASDKYTTVQALPDIIETLQEDENTVFLPITNGTAPVCHVVRSQEEE